jgi:hypothetical protein
MKPRQKSKSLQRGLQCNVVFVEEFPTIQEVVNSRTDQAELFDTCDALA